ncbi:hypothetical protein COT75_01620 [Candidatus Beckwithbacteria bacterium CG10_big_fil_rev_8_21_14_0_10_34_10]|uniref:Glycosyl transferase family 1 domain-containing protein n=1 Tax=Candidatus Beckwithbacteria bacterium CG10_big_fil_rev_8_21_14_0_10_34_10 TaxID=1974495 RepID=A0A2H0W9L3_9BACT|nr:MAG: hypothetical protein COT75_01620 [Candidatus Beckwithbacteria bacterium CG10_big_fil_rev_8_21_14_0_10_34_10]
MNKVNSNLGIFLSPGDSFSSLKKSGQDSRFFNYYLSNYKEKFDQVYIFTYDQLKLSLPKSCFVLENKHNWHRFFYQFLIPFVHLSRVKNIDVFRVMQLTGVIPAIICRIFFKKPFIFTYGYDYYAFAKFKNQRIRPILLKGLEKIAFYFASGVIVTNKKNKLNLQSKYPRAKIFYVPNGVDTKKFKPEKAKKLLKGSGVNVLTVARLEKQKNLENLIKATALIKDKAKINLLFIGRGKLRSQLILLAKKKEVNLKIIDRVVHNKLSGYYQGADIFCLPSYKEGQPKALIEAMALGLPCLVGNYSGVEEFENKKEILKTGFNPEEIRANLLTLIENHRLRKKLGLKARKKAEQEFNIQKLLAKEIEILKNV